MTLEQECCFKSFLKKLLLINTMIIFEIEFCFLSFSAQESEKVDTLSFNLFKSKTGLSNDLVVAIDFLDLRDSKSKLDMPFNSCCIFNSTIDKLDLTHCSGKLTKSKAFLHPTYFRRLVNLFPIPHISFNLKYFKDFSLLQSVFNK